MGVLLILELILDLKNYEFKIFIFNEKGEKIWLKIRRIGILKMFMKSILFGS